MQNIYMEWRSRSCCCQRLCLERVRERIGLERWLKWSVWWNLGSKVPEKPCFGGFWFWKKLCHRKVFRGRCIATLLVNLFRFKLQFEIILLTNKCSWDRTCEASPFVIRKIQPVMTNKRAPEETEKHLSTRQFDWKFLKSGGLCISWFRSSEKKLMMSTNRRIIHCLNDITCARFGISRELIRVLKRRWHRVLDFATIFLTNGSQISVTICTKQP